MRTWLFLAALAATSTCTVDAFVSATVDAKSYLIKSNINISILSRGNLNSPRRNNIGISSISPMLISRLSSSDNETSAGNISKNDPTKDEVERLIQSASKLRAEAQALEKARPKPKPSVVEDFQPVKYFDINDSCWEITYRFANEPESKTDDPVSPPRKFYNGKLRLRFRSDGYSDMLPLDASKSFESGANTNLLTFRKVWGWDFETSNVDNLDYVLFSADIALGPPIDVTERFYFQARVDKAAGKTSSGENGSLSLSDGSITVKRNINSSTGGWWGLFRGADGILAQFRNVGEFKCKPIHYQFDSEQ